MTLVSNHMPTPVLAGTREAKLMIATGFRGVGKTHETMNMLLRDYIKGENPRRVLILDVNDEYGEFGVLSIDPKHIQMWMRHPTIEIRRLRPFVTVNGVTRKLTVDEIMKLLSYVLEVYAGGCLLIEDINKLVGDNMPGDLTGTICTTRHINCDIIMHYQSVARPLPKIWQNTNVIRFHHQSDDVLSSKGKLLENTEPLKICQMMVDSEYYAGNVRFFVYYDRDIGGIIGNFSKQKFMAILEEYISENPSCLRSYLAKRDMTGKKVFQYPQAVEAEKQKLFTKYWKN